MALFVALFVQHPFYRDTDVYYWHMDSAFCLIPNHSTPHVFRLFPKHMHAAASRLSAAQEASWTAAAWRQNHSQLELYGEQIIMWRLF